jgi:hypothetical protein
MKFAKSLLMGTGGVALSGLLLALLAPQAAHGLVAALVQVANTASAPAIASLIDDPGRVAFMQNASFSCFSAGSCTYVSPSAVPAGHRVVIQHVSGALVFQSTPSWILVTMLAQTENSITPAFFNVPPGPAGGLVYFDQPILFYFDAGQFPQVNIFANLPLNETPITQLTLIGYELDCTSAPCAAIANH